MFYEVLDDKNFRSYMIAKNDKTCCKMNEF